MWRIRNIQQQCMTSMIRIFSILLIALLASACTRMPTEYRDNARVQAGVATDYNKLSVIASAVIGSPTIYTDQVTGLTTELVVESEYFSANGRICRRFTERQPSSASSHRRLGCNGSNGWVEIPIQSFAG